MNRTFKIPAEQFRFGESEVQQDRQLIRMSVASEAEILREDEDTGEQFYEVLDHSPNGIDTSRLQSGTSLLFNHKRDILLGLNIKHEVKDGRTFVESKISQAPDVESYRIKIEEGILRSTSVGYKITGPGKRTGTRNGIPVYKFPWRAHEVSLVTIEADTTTGIGRSEPDKSREFMTIEVREDEGTLKNEKTSLDGMQLNGDKRRMTDEQIAALEASLKTEKERAEKAELALKDANEAKERAEKEAVEAREKAVKDALGGENKRTAEIYKLGGDIEKAHSIDLSEAVRSHISEGKSLEEFRNHVLTTNFKAKPLPTGGKEGNDSGAMKRDAFEKLNPSEKKDFCLKGGKITD